MNTRPTRQGRIDAHADQIANRLDIDRKTIEVNGHGVVLTPTQLDMLFQALVRQGWENAAATMREAADKAREEGQHSTRVGAFATGAGFLRDQIQEAKKYEVCRCRCKRGSHCGGCGHDGCGYVTEIGS